VSLYLDLLKRTLTGMAWEDPPIPVPWDSDPDYAEDKRARGLDWPQRALTFVGLARLDHLQWCAETALDDGVRGDLLEAGVCRGGASMFMRAVLKERGVTDRCVWAADSFAGFPAGAVQEEHLGGAEQDMLAVSLEQVRHNFGLFGLLDDQVRFLPGYFADTLPGPVGELAVLRLDADLHSATWSALSALYPKVAPGGFVIVDDWALPGCQHAVRHYRTVARVNDPMWPADGYDHDGPPASMFWRKS
jgi:Macrocin-O-methyltransferase (TylF)